MKMELLKAGVIYEISKQIDEIELDETRIADTEAINLLADIRCGLANENITKAERADLITELFEKTDIHIPKEKNFKVCR